MNRFLRILWAFRRRDLQEQLSYKWSSLWGLAGILTNSLTFFFIAKVFGHGASQHLASYGGEYFPFVLVGIALVGFQSTAMSIFHTVIAREQHGGSLEAILMTSTSLWMILMVQSFWGFLSTTLRVAGYFLVGALFFKVDLSRIDLVSAGVILLLTTLSLSGLGLLSAGFLMAFKGGDPINLIVNGASRFLSGVYFPVSVLPVWVQKVSLFFPLTASLEGMRRAVLEGRGLFELRQEISWLTLFSMIFLPLGIGTFRWAVRKSRRDGSLLF